MEYPTNTRFASNLFGAFCGVLLSFRVFAAEPPATVFFFPFQIETYVGISKGSIESTAAEKWTITDPAEISRLLEILSRGAKVKSTDFGTEVVRAKVYIGDRTYFVDGRGVVQTGNETRKIDPEEFTKFRASLRSGQIHVIFPSERSAQ